MINIIYPDGRYMALHYNKAPSLHYLATWIGCEYVEIVRVFYKGEYEQLIVDEEGIITHQPLNQEATLLYHENVRIHQPELLIDAPKIHGIAVLLTGEHKLG